MATRIASPCHISAQSGIASMRAIHSPWRTVRRTSRTEWARRPSSKATMGETARSMPMPKIIGVK